MEDPSIEEMVEDIEVAVEEVTEDVVDTIEEVVEDAVALEVVVDEIEDT